MDRNQAQAPLKEGEARIPCTVGLVGRGQVRRAAIMSGVDYYEEKGWLSSTFILRGEANRVITLVEQLEQHFG